MRIGPTFQFPIRILATAFAFIAMSALAGFAWAEEMSESAALNPVQVAQTDPHSTPSNQRHLEITLQVEERENERCNRIAKEHSARLAAISATIGIALTQEEWYTYRFCDMITKRFRFEHGCPIFVSKRLDQLHKIMDHNEFRECEFGYLSDLSDTSAADYNECVAARKCKETIRVKHALQQERMTENIRQQERAALAKKNAPLIAEIASKMHTKEKWGGRGFCNRVAGLYDGGYRHCLRVVNWRQDQLRKVMMLHEFSKCEFAYLSDVSDAPVDNYNKCVETRKREEILQKERDIQKTLEVENKRQQERERELEIARRQAEIEAERIKRENEHRETLAKERARVAESVRASLESARAAEVAAAEAEQRVKLARQETERQIAEAKEKVKRERKRVESAALAKRTDEAKPLFAPSSSLHASVTVVRKRWKSLSIAELNAVCTEVAQRGHSVDIDSWGLWDEHTIYSGKFLAFDKGQFRGRNFRVVCNVMTCAAALASQCDSQGDTAVLIGLIDPINGEVVHSFSPVRWAH